MRVYIITAGEYSAYTIVAVAETYEEAQSKAAKWAVATHASYDEPRIEVWDSELGELDGAERKTWNILVNYDGTVECTPIDAPCSFGFENNEDWRSSTIEYCFRGIRAKDEEHARKIGYDMLAEVKAAAADLWWRKPENDDWVKERRARECD